MNPEDLKPEQVEKLAREHPDLVVAAVCLLQGELALTKAKLLSSQMALRDSEGVPA